MDIEAIIFELGTARYRVTLTAKKRMAEKNITHADIRRCVVTAHITKSKDGKIKLEGFDLDDYIFTIICTKDSELLITTIL